MFHFSTTVIKVYATLFIAAVHFHDRPSKFFFFNASSLQVQAVGMGIMGSYDHLTPIYISFFFVCQVSEYDGLLYLDHLAALIYTASGTFFIAY